MSSVADPYAVSVVIPCYNYAHYLPDAVNSVLAQDYPHVECIVIDDGSKDRTREVAEGYGDRIRYVYKQNAGLSAARNTGIEVATSPFIVFLDADDWYAPTFLSTMMAAFRTMPDSVGLLACDMNHVNADGSLQVRKSLPEAALPVITVFDLLVKNQYCPASAVLRRSVFATCGGFDTSLTSTEDREMWLRVASRYEVRMLDKDLVFLRNHGASMSKNADRMKANMLRVLRKCRLAQVMPQSRRAGWAKAYSYNHFHMAWMYYDEGRALKGIGELLKSWCYWPFFGNPRRYNDPVLFRLRALRRFCLTLLTGGTPAVPSAGGSVKPDAQPKNGG